LSLNIRQTKLNEGESVELKEKSTACLLSNFCGKELRIERSINMKQGLKLTLISQSIDFKYLPAKLYERIIFCQYILEKSCPWGSRGCRVKGA